MNKTNKIVLILVVIVIAVASFYFLYFKKTPSYTIGVIYQSIKSHDVATFDHYVDLDSILSKAFDEILKEQVKDTGTDDIELIKAFAGLFKPAVISTLKDKIKETIAEKNDAAQPVTNPNQKQSTSPKNAIADKMLDDVKPGAIEFKGVGKTTTSDNIATVDIILLDKKSQQEFTLVAKMTKQKEGYWRLTEIENIAEYINQLNTSNTPPLN